MQSLYDIPYNLEQTPMLERVSSPGQHFLDAEQNVHVT